MKKVCLFFLFFMSVPFFINGQNAKQLFKTGEEFLDNKKYDDAVNQYTQAIQVSPDMTKAYTQRAHVYNLLEKYKEASEDYERALVFLTKDASLYYKSAGLLFKLDKDSLSLVRVNKAIELKSGYMEAVQLKSLILIDMKKYTESIEESKKALKYKDTPENYYNLALGYDLSGMNAEALQSYSKAISKDSKYLLAYIKLSDLQRRMKKYTESLSNINTALTIDPKCTEAYLVRSELYSDQIKFVESINDISTLIVMDPENGSYFYKRGCMYQNFAQHPAAINDFNKVLSLDPKNSDAIYKRAYSYEQIMNFKDAIKDYQTLATLSKYDVKAQEHLEDAQKRLFELNREADKPVISIIDPVEKPGKIINIAKGISIIPLTGAVQDKSELKNIAVNGFTVPFKLKDDKYEFLASVNLTSGDIINVQATDIYDNVENITYLVNKIEIEGPVIRVIAPYASDNKMIYLDSNDPNVYVEGTLTDESLIKSINIDGVLASFIPTNNNPSFNAYINVANKNKFTIIATDVNNNSSEVTYLLNREGAGIAADNPMGKTWIVFIENSQYSSFASLEGPEKDITLMKTALAKYTVHNFIHKKDLTKQEIEKFFAIELRDLLRSNRVNSLLIWYAGHGKFVNETGYWVPADAKRDDEFTYFNINALKASMQSYPKEVNHLLVITDACESGPSFYQAMRGPVETRNCSDWSATRLKSSQVFSSAGYELAVDNSQFTRTFANVLANSPDACTSIESVVQIVTSAAEKSLQQKPQFGKIAGLEDENGTFFFMAK